MGIIAYPASADMDTVQAIFDWATEGRKHKLSRVVRYSLQHGKVIGAFTGDAVDPEEPVAMFIAYYLCRSGLVKTPKQLAAALDIYLHPRWGEQTNPQAMMVAKLFEGDQAETMWAGASLGEALIRQMAGLLQDVETGRLTVDKLRQGKAFRRIAQASLLILLTTWSGMTAMQAARILDLAFPGEPLPGTEWEIDQLTKEGRDN